MNCLVIQQKDIHRWDLKLRFLQCILRGLIVNRYRKGANLERATVNEHIEKGAVFAGRFAGSKNKGSIKVDVIALYALKDGTGVLHIQQLKKGSFSKAEKRKYEGVKLPDVCKIEKTFITVD